jgi:hypothetical protein
MNRELIGGIFWMVFGIVLCSWSGTYEIGTFRKPDTGLMPFLLGAFLIVLSVSVIVQAVRSKADKDEKEVKIFSGNWKKAGLVVVVLVVACFLFEWIGYLLTFFLMSVVLMILGECESWKQIAIVAFCTTLGIYLCFVVLLKQQLPKGILGV